MISSKGGVLLLEPYDKDSLLHLSIDKNENFELWKYSIIPLNFSSRNRDKS